MKNSSPNVSVIIAAYNHARYLPECLDSILAQTYQGLEIVVVDDGSQDGSHELLLDYQSRFPDKVHYYWHPGHVNQGQSASLNLAIAKSRGDYIAWIGSDDAWYPDKLEQQISLLQSHPEIGFVYGLVHIVDEIGKIVKDRIGTDGLWGTDISECLDPIASLVEANEIPAITVITRRECLEKIGLFDESLVYSDWELLIRILAHWKAGFINRPLALYRIHGTNISIGQPREISLKRSLDVMSALKIKASTIGGGLATPQVQPLINHKLTVFNLQLSNLSLEKGDTNEAIQRLNFAFEFNPLLSNDPRYCAEMFNGQRDYRSLSEKGKLPDHDFSFWALANLPTIVSNKFRQQLAGLLFGEAAFLYYSIGDLHRTKQMALKCLLKDPFNWLRNKGLLVIFLESIIGTLRMNQLRIIKKMLE